MSGHKAFLSVSFQHRSQLAAEFEAIASTLKHYGMDAVDFVRQYRFEAGDEDAMMARARAEIATCDVLIAEVTEKAIGVGIEIGYAAALGKPIIYLRKVGAEYSTTVGGLATQTVIYNSPDDLSRQLLKSLRAVFTE